MAAVLLICGGTAFAMDQRIPLNVDGEERTVHTFGATVQDVLDSADVDLGEHDAVAPSPRTELERGDHVLVRSGRELTLDVDGGASRSHWVTALSVGEALDQLGMADEPLKLSVDRGTRIPRAGLEVDAAPARHVAILRDRVRVETTTTAATVGGALSEAGIEPGEHDIVKPGLDEKPTDGMVIDVTELLGKPEVKKAPIEAKTTKRKNPDLEKGTKKVVKKKKDGVKLVKVATVLKEGKKTEHVVKKKVARKPKNGVVEVGTKEPETSVGGGSDNLNWDALAECESGGDPSSVNSSGGYYGLYQFSPSTWQAAGGSGSPADASKEEQTMRAKKLYKMSGGNWQSQWPECGKHL